MSTLTELWKTISLQLHMPELARPLLQEMIVEIDVLHAKTAALEQRLAASTAGLAPEMVEVLNKDWARHVELEAKRQAVALAQEAEAAAKAAAEAAQAAGAAAASPGAAEPAGSTAGTDQTKTDSGGAGDNANASPQASPEPALAGAQTSGETTEATASST